MKFSEMSTEQATDVVLKITDPVSRILSDPQTGALLAGMRTATNNADLLASAITQAVPLLLKEHKEDTFVTIAALSGKTVAALKKQNILQTIRDAQEIFSDRELLDFFTPSKERDTSTATT